MAGPGTYGRHLWQLTVGGRDIRFQGDVTWNPPDELQNINILKDASGRGAKVTDPGQANVCTFTVTVVQETGEDGVMTEFAHNLGSGQEMHFSRRVTGDLEDGTEIAYITPRGYVGAQPKPYSSDAQVVVYQITAIGYRIDRKNAASIERLSE